MPKQLSEPAAWRKLAEWYATNTGWICWNTGGWAGMQVFRQNCATKPFDAPWLSLYHRVKAHADMGALEWYEGNTVAEGLARPFDVNSNPRVIFCLLMALEAEEEGQ